MKPLDTPRPYHHGGLRRKLLDATLQIVAQQGVEGVTMREVSRRLGVSHAAAYRHFKNKHDLLCAVAESGFNAMAVRSRALAGRAGPDPLQTLTALGQGYLAFALANPALYRLMFGSVLATAERPPGLREAAGRAFDFLALAVAQGQEQGRIRPGSSQALANLLWSLMHGLACLLMDGQLQTNRYQDGLPIFLTDTPGRRQSPVPGLMEALVEILLHGLVPRSLPDAS